MAHIPTYQERLASIHTPEDIYIQMDQALKCARAAEIHAEGAMCPATRFNRTQRAREAQWVLERLRDNEDAIESSLCS